MKRKIETYGKAKKEKPIKKKYIIMAVVLVCLFGLMIINRSNDGELNDYENYKPRVDINESEDGEQLSEELGGVVVEFTHLITWAIAGIVFLQILNAFRGSDISS